MSETSVGAQGGSFSRPTSGGAIVWRRFRRDRIALAALVGLVLIVLLCFAGEPLLEHLLGHGPDEPFISPGPKPGGFLTWVDTPHGRQLFVLGGDGQLGRDEFLRLLAGGQISLEMALVATSIALLIGLVLGTTAGYFGGAADSAISRFTDLFMSFPLLLLVIALGQTAAQRFQGVTLHGVFQPGVLALAVVIGLFTWFYPARVTRTLVASLREQEFVEAAHMVGARDGRIIRKELLPHLTGPLIVWATLVGAGVIVLEASLSVLNFGVRFGTASWGSLLAGSWGTLLNFNPGRGDVRVYGPAPFMLKAAPSVALFLTVLCLVLIGDGLRSALDPRGER